MAEVKNDEEVPQHQHQHQQHAHAMPAKRKTDPPSVDEDIDKDGNEKKQRLENSAADNNGSSVLPLEKEIDAQDEEDDDEEDYEDEDHEEEEEEEDEDEDEDGEDEDFDDEHSNGKAVVDRKGKGILREDKGKGKLIEESDDSSDGGAAESDGDSSDLSEDPLAEVDLDNILPSRTRRRSVQPGLRISKDTHDGDA